MPSVSEAQRRAMQAAAHGKSTLGIPKAVGKEFVKADRRAVSCRRASRNAGHRANSRAAKESTTTAARLGNNGRDVTRARKNHGSRSQAPRRADPGFYQFEPAKYQETPDHTGRGNT